jgi:glycosyltransferase involved in cell wall biosynthesis
MKEKQVLLSLQIYNEIANIEQCVDSIKSQNVDFLCLISDNFSTDGTREFLVSFVSRNSKNFVLVSPEDHINIAKHFAFVYSHYRKGFEAIPYRMIMGGDDYLDSPNFLRELISSIEASPEFDISVPIYQLRDEVNSSTRNLSLRIEGENYFKRMFFLAFYPTRLGNYNFVISLMKKDAFDFWASTLINFMDKQKTNSRPKDAEVIASFRLLQKHNVILNDKATYVKRIHNPNRSDRLRPISIVPADNYHDYSKILRMHFQSYISIFLMAKKFKKEMKLGEFSWYLFLGSIAFIVGWLDFFYLVLSRSFSKSVLGSIRSQKIGESD